MTVAFTPPDREALVRAWLGPSVALHPQCEEELGQRMAAAITDAFHQGAEQVAVIGTDCPGVSAGIVEGAFNRLARAEVVLGPTSDGGYYLIAVSRPIPGLFAGIPWSSPYTLRATLDASRSLWLRVELLDQLSDIDTAEDWAAWRALSQASDATEVDDEGR